MTDGAELPETWTQSWTREERAAYRAFVRDHHPDRGGDPEAFVEGLARLRAARDGGPADAVRSTGPPGSAHPDPDVRRYDAPVEIVPDLPLAVRIVVAAIRTARRRARTRVDRHDPDPGVERE
ncbi:hypothetical protein GCM10023215_48760 [Pseudonocardia yuanmonensis]|uniref:J domain-containing protein n=1 Tax=Pseudonocardia yuanmonensis TaxID=1095914 RepID=A0ABP8X974_9PSEU